ncbi:MAG: MFS transporter [Oscillospiraceae bacterium]|nr:MFS transporter [Oscillospiraceae bacterium]
MTAAIQNFKRTKFACFYTYVAMSSVFSLPPLLFVTFRETYGISYTLLGTLVLINFCTQLTIDLIFTFFTKYFNIKKTVRVMPLLTALGLSVYALVPTLFPQHAYAGLVLGTVIFSVAAGLCEVLLSPLVAALPSDNPERDMSLLHSLYGWGVVLVVGVSTLYFAVFGTENWMYLTLFWALLPVGSFVLYSVSPIPAMDLTHSDGASPKKAAKRTVGMALCVACIFLGSSAENAMTNWISAFIENALHIPKAVGDILGLALFAFLLASTRTIYAKHGRNIYKMLLVSMAGAFIFYVVAGISPSTLVAMLACVLLGICTSMLWPGTLILMEEKMPNPGVAAYALMAAGGDFGGSIAPQLLGAMVDSVAASDWGIALAQSMAISPEQVGMKAGVLVSSLFPLAGIGVLLIIGRYFKKVKL